LELYRSFVGEIVGVTDQIAGTLAWQWTGSRRWV
jgi:hypothetical protein